MGWWPVQGRIASTAPRRRTAIGGVVDLSLVIWFRLVPDAQPKQKENRFLIDRRQRGYAATSVAILTMSTRLLEHGVRFWLTSLAPTIEWAITRRPARIRP